uniref:Interleukin-1 receptor-associated kinase 4 n=1 Tax=Petromyzon marinus TaxID=7757 RepID=S4R4V7_PETMA
MNQVPISRETLVRKLAFSPRESLASLLDPDDAWRKLAAQIPNSLGQPRYTMLQIRRFEKVVQAGRSPTMELLNDWGTQNCTVGNLVDLLVKLEFYNAADQLLPSASLNGPTDTHHLSVVHITAVPPSDNGSVCESSLLYAQPCCSPGLGVGMSILSTKRAGRGSENIEERVVEPTSPTELTVIGIKAGTTQVTLTLLERVGVVSVHPSDDPSRCLTHLAYTDSSAHASDVEKFEFTALLRMTGGFNDAPLLQGGSKIGEGGFGLVYLGRIGTNAVAVKKLTACSPIMKTQFTKEIHTLSSCRHENLVELLGYSCDGPQLCLVYPYMSNGSLSERLACKDNTPPLTWATRLSVAEGAAKGIAFLHANNHIHRDIKT